MGEQWQEIQTAPADGTYILVWSSAWRHPFVAQYYGETFEAWLDIPTPIATKQKTFVTHWRDLPTPPLDRSM